MLSLILSSESSFKIASFSLLLLPGETIKPVLLFSLSSWIPATFVPITGFPSDIASSIIYGKSSYSKEGFNLDVKRRGCNPIEWYEKLKRNFDKPDYFQTEKAKKIAMKELEKRKKEINLILS